MEFKTMENRYRPKTPSGSNLIPTYKETVNKEGRTILKKSGTTNIYEKIQASLEETKVYNILEQFLQSGDETILKKRQGVYADFSNVPKTEIELQNIVLRAEQEFNALDKDVRAEFDYDVGVFKRSILDNTFEERMQKYLTKKINNNKPNQTTQTEQNQQTEVTNNE